MTAPASPEGLITELPNGKSVLVKHFRAAQRRVGRDA